MSENCELHPHLTVKRLSELMGMDDPEVRHRLFGKQPRVPVVATCMRCRKLIEGS